LALGLGEGGGLVEYRIVEKLDAALANAQIVHDAFLFSACVPCAGVSAAPGRDAVGNRRSALLIIRAFFI
jgi:hypothetical protein